MAEADITSAGTGDWNAGATWTGGAVPDTDQHAIIQSGHNVTINADDEIKSLTVNSGGTLTGNSSYSLTINGEGSASYGTNYQCVYIRGAIGANVNLIITTGVGTEFDTNSSSGRLTNLTISNTGGWVNWENGMSISGDLVVSANAQFGPYTTGKPITVDGDVTISGTLKDTAGDSQAYTFGSLTINSGGTYYATGGTTTITSKSAGGAEGLNFAGTFTHNNGTVKLALPATDWANLFPNSKHFYNLIIDTGSTQGYFCNDPLIVLNNLDIQDGEITANSASSNDGDITVYGLTTVGTGGDAAKLENVARTVTLHGGITVGANGTFETGTGTVNVGGIRNLGGTIS